MRRVWPTVTAGGLVGSVLVAAPDPSGRPHGRRFGDPDELEREIPDLFGDVMSLWHFAATRKPARSRPANCGCAAPMPARLARIAA